VTGSQPTKSPDPVSGSAPSSDDLGQTLRLRAERPRITRLSRKVLPGGSALALLLISGAVLWALRSNRPHSPAPDELYSTDHHNVADGLTTLPRDYAGIPRDVPRLGPPLPGDLGRPIITAEGQSTPIGLDAEQQRANQETEAARTSKVFASTTAAVQHAASQETPTNTASSSDEAFAQNGQDRKLLFVNAPLIGGLRHPIGFHVQRRHLWCRRGRSFLQLSSQAFARIFPVKSPRKLRNRLLILLLVVRSLFRKERG